MLESVPTKVIEPGGGAPRAIDPNANRSNAAAAVEICKHAQRERMADVVIAFRIAPARVPAQERFGRVDMAAGNRAKLWACVELQLFFSPRFWLRCRQFRTRSTTTWTARIPKNITT